MNARELARSCVYRYDDGILQPNPAAFGAGGYECSDPDDLVEIIERAIVAAQKTMLVDPKPGMYKHKGNTFRFVSLSRPWNGSLAGGPSIVVLQRACGNGAFHLTEGEFRSKIESGEILYLGVE